MAQPPHTGGKRGIVPDFWTAGITRRLRVHDPIKQVAADPAQYLESETVTRTDYKKPQPKTGGWANGFKSQLLG